MVSHQHLNLPARNSSKLEACICELESLITGILGVPAPVQRIKRKSFADSPSEDHINMVDMSERFSFPSMRLFDGTSDPDDHVAHHKQNMFVVSMPQNQRKARMCKGFGSSVSRPALQ